MEEKDQKITDLQEKLREARRQQSRATARGDDTVTASWESSCRRLNELLGASEDEKRQLWSQILEKKTSEDELQRQLRSAKLKMEEYISCLERNKILTDEVNRLRAEKERFLFETRPQSPLGCCSDDGFSNQRPPSERHYQSPSGCHSDGEYRVPLRRTPRLLYPYHVTSNPTRRRPTKPRAIKHRLTYFVT